MIDTRLIAQTLAALLCAWVLSYIVDSHFGHYVHLPAPRRATRVLWNPRLGSVIDGRMDCLGFVYYPLIQFDRRWAHPSIVYRI